MGEKIKLLYYKPLDVLGELSEFKDGGVAIIDQIVCAHAGYFIGSFESTFSFRIQGKKIIAFTSRGIFKVKVALSCFVK